MGFFNNVQNSKIIFFFGGMLWLSSIVCLPERAAAQAENITVPAVQSIKDYVIHLPNGVFARNPEDLRSALVAKLDAAEKQIVSGLFEEALEKLRDDILTKTDGCFDGSFKNDWILDCPVQRQLGEMIVTLISYLENPVFTECEEKETLMPLLSDVLGGSIRAFSLRKLNSNIFVERVKQQGAIDVPLSGPQAVMSTTIVAVLPETVRRSDVVTGYFKPLDLAESEGLGPEASWRLGCSAGLDTCGTFSFIDDEDSEPEGMVINFFTGVSFFEPADRLLSSLTGQQFNIEPGCNIFYNVADVNIPIDLEEDGLTADPQALEQLSFQALDTSTPVVIPIVLDSDGEFYRLGPDTVWRRQASIIASVNLIYHVVEPLSSGKFDIRFQIIGQETWLEGYGPFTTDGHQLTREINDPDYFMITHPQNNQLSHFFVGYEMAGLLGKAGGICGLDAVDWRTGLTFDRTFGSDFEHQWNHSWSQYLSTPAAFTLYGRVIVTAHEIGHMLGGRHGFGARTACAATSGGWSRICGTTIMLDGGGGTADSRQPFFTDMNDDSIVDCLSRVVEP